MICLFGSSFILCEILTDMYKTDMTEDAKWLYNCPSTGYYEECDAEEQRIYDMVLCSFMTGRSELQYFSSIPPSNMKALIKYIIKDRRLTINISEKNIKVSYSYQGDYGYYYRVSILGDSVTDEINVYNKLCRLQIEDILSGVDEDWSDYETIKYFHDWICENTEYVRDSVNCYNISGVLVDGQATCQSYAKTFNLLCELSGYRAVEISGYSKDNTHMWSMVEVNGDWYNFDVTWDDTISTVSDKTYCYFGMPAHIMSQTHDINKSYKTWIPEATDKYNMWYAWRQNWVIPRDIQYNDMVVFIASRILTEYQVGEFNIEFAYEDGAIDRQLLNSAVRDAVTLLKNKKYRLSTSWKMIATDTAYNVILEGY